jgi:glycosyltransferase involved in cell wall biosynthesis
MKISLIMQSYLGEYPGSRKNSDKKFLRAVESFINQTDKDSELVIVSDGCEITHRLYYKHYKDESRIKYVYVNKDTPNMYEGEEKFFRGLPRELGRVIATGEVISYMDSDDYLLENSVSTIKNHWTHFLKQGDYKWSMTTRWIDNGIAKELWKPSETVTTFGDVFKVDGLDSYWIESGMKHSGLVMSSTWSLSHKKDIDVKWEDTFGETSEDTIFSRKIRKTGKGFLIQKPYYVICHYSKKWDY